MLAHGNGTEILLIAGFVLGILGVFVAALITKRISILAILCLGAGLFFTYSTMALLTEDTSVANGVITDNSCQYSPGEVDCSGPMTMQFHDQHEELVTIEQYSTVPFIVSNGDPVTIYYNPAHPGEGAVYSSFFILWGLPTSLIWFGLMLLVAKFLAVWYKGYEERLKAELRLSGIEVP
jgi:hypothetical protein